MGSVAARKELEAQPDLPPDLAYLWAWFLRLNATRQRGMGGVSAISETEIRSFFLNRQITPQPWEIELIAQLDAIALQADEDE
jgi:hypothetical protein